MIQLDRSASRELVNGLRRKARRIAERMTGWDIERLDGSNSFLLIDKKRRSEAWVSHRARLRTLFEAYEIDLAIDVGANEGQFGRTLRQWYDGEMISFEPVTSTFSKLSAAAAGDSDWHTYQLALGSSDSTQPINVAGLGVFSSFLAANEYSRSLFGSKSETSSTEVVSVRRLDSFLNEMGESTHAKNVFVKVDTQGFDQEVFKGLGDLLRKVRVLQVELSLTPLYEGMPHWTESVALYEAAGFKVSGMFPVVSDKDWIIEYDCVLVQRDSRA